MAWSGNIDSKRCHQRIVVLFLEITLSFFFFFFGKRVTCGYGTSELELEEAL